MGADSRPAADSGQREHAEEISRLFKEHNRTLMLFLAARLKNQQLAKDVAQEAYVKVLQLQTPGTVSFLRSYLFRVAANLAVDRLRQNESRARLDAKEPFENFIEECTPARVAEARDELASLKKYVGELPPRYQQAFQLHGLQEHSFEQVAELMNIKPRMVRHYVTLALVYVRLRREGVGKEEAWRRIHD
jgi:RNA polymerase sigma-70 factor (ECF subfamily)